MLGCVILLSDCVLDVVFVGAFSAAVGFCGAVLVSRSFVGLRLSVFVALVGAFFPLVGSAPVRIDLCFSFLVSAPQFFVARAVALVLSVFFRLRCLTPLLCVVFSAFVAAIGPVGYSSLLVGVCVVGPSIPLGFAYFLLGLVPVFAPWVFGFSDVVSGLLCFRVVFGPLCVVFWFARCIRMSASLVVQALGCGRVAGAGSGGAAPSLVFRSFLLVLVLFCRFGAPSVLGCCRQVGAVVCVFFLVCFFCLAAVLVGALFPGDSPSAFTCVGGVGVVYFAGVLSPVPTLVIGLRLVERVADFVAPVSAGSVRCAVVRLFRGACAVYVSASGVVGAPLVVGGGAVPVLPRFVLFSVWVGGFALFSFV
ncbi:hypothetical protein SAMN04488032_103244 [Pacificibacter marinus]|nr:hypothetical protein SAMN04488032_103244 [Pacificibacter marinus]